MSEDENSAVEKIHEDLHEHAEQSREGWIRYAAVLSAIFAVFSSLAGMISSHDADTAMLAQIQASDQWAYYQAKGIKATIRESEAAILKNKNQDDSAARGKAEIYHAEQEDIKKKAEALSDKSTHAFERHEMLSRGVSLFQIGIVMIAIGVLVKRRKFVVIASVFALLGLCYLGFGFL